MEPYNFNDAQSDEWQFVEKYLICLKIFFE